MLTVLCVYMLSRVTPCDPMGCSPPGSSVHGILQVRNWSGLPFPPPGNLPDLETEPVSPALADGFFTAEPQGKPRTMPDFLWSKKIRESEKGLGMFGIVTIIESPNSS